MIDTIYLNKRGECEELVHDKINKKWRKYYDENLGRYIFISMKTFGKFHSPIVFKYDKCLGSLKVEFSLHKYLFGENYKNYNPITSCKIISTKLNKDLREFLRIDINEFNINRIDFGINIITPIEAVYYVKTFDTILPHKNGTKRKSWYRNESLMLNDKTTSVLIYDKISELKERGIYLSQNNHILRFEYQIKKTQGIKARHRFNGRINFENLLTKEVYLYGINFLPTTFSKLLPFEPHSITNDTMSIYEYLSKKFSKRDILNVMAYYNEFNKQTTNMNLIEAQLRTENDYLPAKSRKIIKELKTLLISNSNLGYRNYVEEVYNAINKEIGKQKRNIERYATYV